MLDSPKHGVGLVLFHWLIHEPSPHFIGRQASVLSWKMVVHPGCIIHGHGPQISSDVAFGTTHYSVDQEGARHGGDGANCSFGHSILVRRAGS